MKKISIAFVLLLILGLGFWQLPLICATFGMPLPQSLAFLNDYQLNSPKEKSPPSTVGSPSPSNAASPSTNVPSLSSPLAAANGASNQSPLPSELESKEVTVNKQPLLPGDVFANNAPPIGPDTRLSSPLPGANTPTSALPAPQIPATLITDQSTPDGSKVLGCLVSAMDIYGEAKVPAQEPGVILELTKTQGMMVKAGESIGRIDDNQPIVALKAAKAEILGKKLQAESKERYKFSVISTDTYQVKLNKLIEANRTAPNSVSYIELKETELMVEKSKVEGKLALEEMDVAKFAVASKEAEADGLQQAIDRRKLTSPVNGVIKEITPHIGEWVKPGDVVFHVINMDRLQVSGTFDLLNDKKIGRSELLNRDVMFEFEYKKGEVQRVPAKIVFVDPTNEYASTKVKVKAEIINRYDETTKDWLVHPNNYGDLLLFPNAR